MKQEELQPIKLSFPWIESLKIGDWCSFQTGWMGIGGWLNAVPTTSVYQFVAFLKNNGSSLDPGYPVFLVPASDYHPKERFCSGRLHHSLSFKDGKMEVSFGFDTRFYADSLEELKDLIFQYSKHEFLT